MPVFIRAVAYSLLLGIFTTLVGACSLAQTTAPDTVVQQQVVNAMTVTLETAEELRVNQRQEFVVTLTDPQGQPVAANVYLDLVMPVHPMGLNQPIATPTGSGVYQAVSVFPMDGAWTVTVVATVQGQKHQAIFNVNVSP
jgi:hypothetical protein